MTTPPTKRPQALSELLHTHMRRAERARWREASESDIRAAIRAAKVAGHYWRAADDAEWERATVPAPAAVGRRA
jgi:hypothetical protein